jgi:hypothetical protein
MKQKDGNVLVNYWVTCILKEVIRDMYLFELEGMSF